MKNVLKLVVKDALATFGLELHKAGQYSAGIYGLDNFFRLLRRLRFSPTHIIDIGANHGHWTRAAFRYFSSAKYTLIEPQDHLKSDVQDLINSGCKINWITAGCSDAPGELPFILSHRDDSSTFVQKDRYGKATTGKTVTMPVLTLNQFATSHGSPEMVKIDAEGFDLKVLNGASDLFGKTDIFLVEAQICANYDTSIANVIGFMTKAGYDLMDITDLLRSPKHGYFGYANWPSFER